MRRTEARELFMQLLFQMEVQENYGQELKDRFVEDRLPQSSQLSYFNQMFEMITEHLDEIDATIETSSNNWKIKRLAKVDLAILRLAVAEILYAADIPDSAAINEAVDLAKKFGSEDSGKFVNGVLGKIARGKNE